MCSYLTPVPPYSVSSLDLLVCNEFWRKAQHWECELCYSQNITGLMSSLDRQEARGKITLFREYESRRWPCCVLRNWSPEVTSRFVWMNNIYSLKKYIFLCVLGCCQLIFTLHVFGSAQFADNSKHITTLFLNAAFPHQTPFNNMCTLQKLHTNGTKYETLAPLWVKTCLYWHPFHDGSFLSHMNFISLSVCVQSLSCEQCLAFCLTSKELMQ